MNFDITSVISSRVKQILRLTCRFLIVFVCGLLLNNVCFAGKTKINIKKFAVNDLVCCPPGSGYTPSCNGMIWSSINKFKANGSTGNAKLRLGLFLPNGFPKPDLILITDTMGRLLKWKNTFTAPTFTITCGNDSNANATTAVANHFSIPLSGHWIGFESSQFTIPNSTDSFEYRLLYIWNQPAACRYITGYQWNGDNVNTLAINEDTAKFVSPSSLFGTQSCNGFPVSIQIIPPCTYPQISTPPTYLDSLYNGTNTYTNYTGIFTGLATGTYTLVTKDSITHAVISTNTINVTMPPAAVVDSNVTACTTFTWTANNNTYTTSGIYTTTGTNSTGCNIIKALVLTINPNSSSVLDTTISCSYTWPITGSTYTASGTYTGTTLNTFACVQHDTLHLTIDPSNHVDPAIDQPISCYGNHDGSIQAIAYPLSNAFTYIRSGAAQTPDTNTTGFFNHLQPGTHFVHASSGGCASDSSVSVPEPAPLDITFVTDSLVTCHDSDGVLSISITGGTALLGGYLTWWTNNAGDTINDIVNNNYALTLDSLPRGFYNVAIEDDNGCFYNETDSIEVQPCNPILHVTCFLQGYYEPSLSMMLPVLSNQGQTSVTGACDSITVELHSGISPYALVASKKVVLMQNGNATCNFTSVYGSKYVVIKHRNTIETWSDIPVLMDSILNFNFSTLASKAYGSNQVQVKPGVWGFYSGDLNQDENIDLIDYPILENDITLFNFGYFATDINGDGNVDLLDLPYNEMNISNFIFSSHP